MKQESELFIQNCDICHKFYNIIHVLTAMLHFVSIPWLFYKWGVDIVGLFSPGYRLTKVHFGRHRLFHQMGRGGGLCTNKGNIAHIVYAEEHYMSVWSTTFHRLRKWAAIH